MNWHFRRNHPSGVVKSASDGPVSKPGVDLKTPPKVCRYHARRQVLRLRRRDPENCSRRTFTDEPILAQMKRIGIERGKSFDIDKVDPAIKAALEARPRMPRG